MTYSTVHIRRNKQHAAILIDDITNLPPLFAAIYLTETSAQKRFGTQKKEAISLKLLYGYWYKKFKLTFDCSFKDLGYNIHTITRELLWFFEYLNTQTHSENGAGSLRGSYLTNANHVRVASRFFSYLNTRYMNQIYQNLTSKDSALIQVNNQKLLNAAVRELSRFELTQNSPANRYKSITKEQHVQLNEMLLPSLPSFRDPISGELFIRKENNLNPFKSDFLQFRNFLIHRLMYNYGLRVGETLLLTVASVISTQPDSQGIIRYLLSVENLPDDFTDPRANPLKIKNDYSNRIIELEINDFNYLNIYIQKYRTPLFTKSNSLDHGLLFINEARSLSPISYDAIRKIYKKIDLAFITLHPSNRRLHSIENMTPLTPHVGRHTWAYITLEHIYKELLKQQDGFKNNYGISTGAHALLDYAADRLRQLGGWSLSSKMPYRYARRFVELLANQANLDRIKNGSARGQKSEVSRARSDEGFDAFS